jgi:hypothetical protein
MTTQQRFLGKYAGSAQQRLCAVWTDPPGAPLCLRAEPSCFDCSHGPQLEHPGALEAGHLFIVLGVASREQAAFTCCYASGGPVRGSKSTLINIHAPASASEALRARSFGYGAGRPLKVLVADRRARFPAIRWKLTICL